MIIKRYNMFEGKNDKFPDIKKIEIDGFQVYIGKDAKSNDYLTFNIAKDSDIWLHAKGVPGSHVVIVVNSNLPSLDLIKKVSELAKKNSKGKNIDNQVVVYCKREFVKKSSEMNDGQVSVDYKNADNITI